MNVFLVVAKVHGTPGVSAANASDYTSFGSRYKGAKRTWIRAKIGIFCLSPNIVKSRGYADFDFFRVGK
jgi:hypothetical protein